MKQRLLLFDIDGTLLDSGGAGAGALLDAAEEILEVSREDLPPLDLAGATDGAVIRQLFSDARRELTLAKITAFWEVYLKALELRLQSNPHGRLHVGVTELLDVIQNDTRFSSGLLTGNIRRGATIKLERFGIASRFLDGGFGDDGEIRNHLAPIALSRMELATQRRFAPDEIIIIGDTPKDIACATALNARCLAVATGIFDSTSLHAHTPWQVHENLSDTCEIIRLLAA
ncbi:HAD family hydrolase [Phragmitibacter flavus]|uniref:phosphoglycolate phosphatase n=1 Tax=Phragmitibacter flavus TaxID=2576071 RepID=A0A5R8K8L3_9BACT|nr:HAD hydrolase-like protein [Phragmitibacter flavus]TLD68295.1 HAD family hydrolase [Phragmitibacter flavus]